MKLLTSLLIAIVVFTQFDLAMAQDATPVVPDPEPSATEEVTTEPTEDVHQEPTSESSETPVPAESETPTVIETEVVTPEPSETATEEVTVPSEATPTHTSSEVDDTPESAGFSAQADFSAQDADPMNFFPNVTEIPVGTAMEVQVQPDEFGLLSLLGTLTYYYVPSGPCVGSSSTKVMISSHPNVDLLDLLGPEHSNPVVFTSPGTYAFIAHFRVLLLFDDYSDCESITVVKASPQLTVVPPTLPRVAGASGSASATQINGYNMTGTLTYRVFPTSDCTGPHTAQSEVPINPAGVLPSSAQMLMTLTGSTSNQNSWQVSYIGDANNNATTSSCVAASVQKKTTNLALKLHLNDNGNPGPVQSSYLATDEIIAVGALSGSVLNATGNLTYQIYSGAGCTTSLDPPVTFTHQVSGGIAEPTAPFAPPASGMLSARVSYAGDANNEASSACVQFEVTTSAPTIALTIDPTSIVVDGSASGTAVLTSATADASGTVTYQVYADAGCSVSVSDMSATANVTDATVETPHSPAELTFTASGSWYWKATYSGDLLNATAESDCVVLEVGKAHPTLSIAIEPESVDAGQSAAATSELNLSSANAGGSVTYQIHSNASCTTPVAGASAVATVTNGVVSPTHTPATLLFVSPGTRYWQATYSGDTNNNTATSSCVAFIVRAVPSLTATWSPAGIMVGGSAQGTASLTDATATASGTVQYQTYSDSACATQLTTPINGTVTMTNGAVPASSSATFTTAGTVYVRASYSGDAFNVGTSSACVALVIDRFSPSVQLSQTPNPTTTGGTFALTASLTGAYGSPAAPLQIQIFEDSGCSLPVSGMAWNVANGASTPPITYAFAGAAYAMASFAGDGNNYAASTSCTPIALQTGSLSASASNTTLQTVGFSFSDQPSAGTIVVTVTDDRGTAEGFTVSISVGAFLYTGASGTQAAIPAEQLTLITTGAPALVSGQACTPTASGASGTLESSTTVMTASSGCGAGTYQQNLEVVLTVPGGSSSGEYAAEITITTSEAP